MGDDPDTADERFEWLREKLIVSLDKKGDKKFDKAFYAEETIAKVKCGS